MINNRICKKIYKLYWKQKAINKRANCSWKQVKNQNDFEIFFKKLKEKSFLENIFNSKEFQSHIPNKTKILENADLAAKTCFALLGSSKKCFTQIPWQHDFKSQHNFKFGSKSNNNSLPFYQDIRIKTHKNAKLDEYFYDIKVPWELSRFQHIFYLGYAYSTTGNPMYAQAFKKQTNNWIDRNPFLLGVNWACPMDVAIRAINFIWGFYFFKDSEDISIKFWEKFFCSLYDHAKYLENNWETSDKPNNHYLADLLGYFYLSFIFDDLNKPTPRWLGLTRKNWCYQEILNQFEQQVLPDGTSYEGSTSYHKLVTEIFWHFYLLCRKNNIDLPASFSEKLNKMFLFLNDCSDGKNLVQIGDNDSGKILLGLKLDLLNSEQKDSFISHYPNFGLTIISLRPNHAQRSFMQSLGGYGPQVKNKSIHITFRHPTYNSKQPTGHFHQDELAITLSINGIPVLVDPGTYLYSANPTWRNKFRSVESHNVLYLNEKNLDNYDLFQLPREEQPDAATIKQDSQIISIENYHDGYRKYGLRLCRKLILNKNEDFIEIKDWILNRVQDDKKQCFHTSPCHPELDSRSKSTMSCHPELDSGSKSTNINWNFIFHPEIKIESQGNNTWLIKHKENLLAIFKSNIKLKHQKGFYSKEYGKIEACNKLVGKNNRIDTESLTTIYLIK